jgi:HD-GYP domain-containing protein (c-di-GMP phosphodiesterase class II)
MEKLASKVQGLELLLKLTLELCSERSLEKVLEKAWAELARVMKAERSSIFLLDEEKGELFSFVALGAQEIRFPKEKGIAGAALTSGEPILVADAYGDPRFNPAIDSATGFRTRSMVSVPLKVPNGERIGVVQVLNRKDGRPFGKEDVALLQALASVVGVAIHTAQLYREQQRATEAVIHSIVRAVEMRTERGIPHAPLVSSFCEIIGRAMGLGEEEVRRIRWAGALHDLGKLSVPDRILLKGEPLTDQERPVYESHALMSGRLLEKMNFQGELAGIEDLVSFHHKHYGGGGFPPGGPQREEIPLGARIIAVSDAIWCRMYPRWGEKPMGFQEALHSLAEGMGVVWDPKVVEAAFQRRAELEEALGKSLADQGKREA